MDVTIFMAFQPGELPNVNYQHTIQRYNKIPENSPFGNGNHGHQGFLGVRVMRGMSISSIEIPPCWKVSV